MYSLARRLTVTVLASELLLTGCITAATLYYEHRQQYRAFDIRLRGRADTVLSAVEDSGDEVDDVMLDRTEIHVPPADLYEVHERSGASLGRSPSWASWNGPVPPCVSPGNMFDLQVNGAAFRAICINAVRVIDPQDEHGGKRHDISVFYAAPRHPVHHALVRTARVLLLTNALVLLLSGGLAVIFVRRGLLPLEALAAEAAQISPRSWNFQPPASAREVRELRTLADTLETVLGRLKRSFEQQRQFTGDAAHELKTAMTIVKSSLQLMNYRERSAAEYREGVEACLTDCDRLESLVRDMLLLASLEGDPRREFAAGTEPLALAPALREVVDRLRPIADMRAVCVQTELDLEARASVNQENAATLAQNLVLNAIQHSYPGGLVTVRLAVNRAGEAEFVVRDRGEGVPAEHLPLLFDRFYRGDPSRSRRSGGTGLGLAICRAIVESAGGTIRLESEPGKGTLVTVVFPAPAQLKQGAEAAGGRTEGLASSTEKSEPAKF